MSQAVTKNKLSGSTNGMGIKVVATATLGTTIHAAVSGTSSWDEIWLWAFNSDTVDRTLTIEFGDATAPDHNIVLNVPHQQGEFLCVPGFILDNGKAVTAFASSANVVTITGYINAIV